MCRKFHETSEIQLSTHWDITKSTFIIIHHRFIFFSILEVPTSVTERLRCGQQKILIHVICSFDDCVIDSNK